MHVNDAQGLERLVGRDLAKMTRTLQFQAREISVLTTLRSDRLKRGAFKIQLADGRVIKAVRFDSRNQAKKVKILSRFLDPSHFPEVIAAYRTALITQWIDGSSLAKTTVSRDILREAALIQACLHTVRLPKEFYRGHTSSVFFWRNKLRQNLDYLVKHGLVNSGEENYLLDIARMESLGSIDVGLAHCDFCPENFVVNEDGKLFVIDIESISVSALAFDLARTTYRWPMSSKERNKYLRWYREISDVHNFLDNFSFWMTLVITGSGVYRIKNNISAMEEPVRSLKKLFRTKSNAELLGRYNLCGVQRT